MKRRSGFKVTRRLNDQARRRSFVRRLSLKLQRRRHQFAAIECVKMENEECKLAC